LKSNIKLKLQKYKLPFSTKGYDAGVYRGLMQDASGGQGETF
jgi:hypothetical protein